MAKNLLVYFRNDIKTLVADVKLGTEPKERLYGVFELEQTQGINILYSDYRHNGVFGKLYKILGGRGLNLIHPYDLLRLLKVDAVLIKDNFSFSTSLVCKLLGKRVIYYDSLFSLSKSRLKNILIKKCLQWSYKVIGYSNAQAKIYSDFYRVDIDKFETIEFALDPGFYNPAKTAKHNSKKVLSIGRDPGRDFGTLAKAITQTDYSLDLVTLPYLLDDVNYTEEQVRIHQRIPYDTLFDLYADAAVVVIPLKEGLSYPSGIRAALEAIALHKPVIISATDYVKANIPESAAIQYVKPESASDLAIAINNCKRDLKAEDFNSITPSYFENISKVKRIVSDALNIEP